MDKSDGELMEGYAHGDEKAFHSLFIRYSPKLNLFLNVRLGKRRGHLLEELYQKIWLKIHMSRVSFDPSRSFSPWFFSIALNTLRDEVGLSSEKLAHSEFEESHFVDEGKSVEAEYILKESADHVYTLLSALPLSQRTAVLLSDRDQLTPAEIAESMGISVVSVRQLISRGRRSVRTSLLELEAKS